MSKGDIPRKRQVSHQQYSDNWERIFGGGKKENNSSTLSKTAPSMIPEPSHTAKERM